MLCAIIGDIVNSRNISDTRRKTPTNDPLRHALYEKMCEVLDRINEEFAEEIMLPFAIRYGDDFEGVVVSSYRSLEIAMRIIRAIYPIKVRIAFGLGNISTMPDNDNVYLSDGPAIHCARNALTQLKKDRKSAGWFNMAFAVEDGHKLENASLLMNTLVMLLASITDGWTEKQLKAVWATESYDGSKDKQKKAANDLGITSSAISDSLRTSKYAVYRKAWNTLIDYLRLESDE